MTPVLIWNTVESDRWSFSYKNADNNIFCYRIRQLPDFSEHRFDYLCKETDQRQLEVAKRQLSMIRRFHELGPDWSVSFRIIKKEDSLTLYLVFKRNNLKGSLDAEGVKRADQRIRSSFINNEYTFEKVPKPQEAGAFDVNWSNEAAEIMKDEQEYHGDYYLNGNCQKFYVPYMWQAANNSMEEICSALMRHPGRAAVEVTAIPASYLDDEKAWMNGSIRFMKECMNGEVIRGQQGNVLWTGKKLPILKTPIDNFDKINKQYETSRVFLSSIRVFAERDASSLASAFIVNSSKSEGQILAYRRGEGQFEYLKSAYTYLDVSASIHTSYWYNNKSTAPYRAQRLNRLYSLEELSNFFRIPIPIRPGFPGFRFDTGLGAAGTVKKSKRTIVLGSYQDNSLSLNEKAGFGAQQLAKHGLIVGVPGSGKTTAIFNILDQLWNVPEEDRIPFIVLEPAKTEYRALKRLPEFEKDLLVFSLGDEGVSPFRFNPMEVLPGIKLESHMSRLQACFIGAFDLFDPLPIFLEQAIRRTYKEKGWYEDSIGGEPGVETPTLSDLCRNAEYIVENSGFDSKMRADFKASLLERLNSLRRGSKGRMLDTPSTIPMKELMEKPVIMELDSLNGDEKSLMMMFLLTYVFEYCKIKRQSGSPLKHMLLVEEAHNLIPATGDGNGNRADPKMHTIELFVNMLAEMRALGQGILIADQLPTAIAPQAVKQTNVKILMRVTARDDREEIGNTMDLNDEQMHQVVNFKTGHAYVYHEGEDRVRMVRMVNFKDDHNVEYPPGDEELHRLMSVYEQEHAELFKPFPQCSQCCGICDRRVRNQAESLVLNIMHNRKQDIYRQLFEKEDASVVEKYRKTIAFCSALRALTKREEKRIMERYKTIGDSFGACVYIHMMNLFDMKQIPCPHRGKKCSCGIDKWNDYISKFNG